MDKIKIGTISAEISSAISRPDLEGKDVYLGQSNINHMKNSHPNDYELYGKYITFILENPDYACVNEKDGSIELVKEFHVNNDYVKLAIRISCFGILYSHQSPS